jgi:hypothetical protein
MTAMKLLTVSVLTFVSILVGCGPQGVRCDGKLTPINAPAPVNKAAQPLPAKSQP